MNRCENGGMREAKNRVKNCDSKKYKKKKELLKLCYKHEKNMLSVALFCNVIAYIMLYLSHVAE